MQSAKKRNTSLGGKIMKKILAVLLTLAMVLAFAACGEKPAEEPTGTTPEATSEPVSEEASEPVSEEASEAASEVASEVASEAASTEAASEASKGLESTDIAAVVAYYNAAVKATEGKAPKGKQTMKLVDGSLDGDGAIGAIVKVLEPAAVKALEKNSTSTDYIPGHEDGEVLASDATKATATSKNGVTTIEITLKSQTDGPNADANNAGPVARAIGTLGSIETALNELGATISEGKDTVKLTYDHAYIKCTVDEATGKITGGTWHYLVNVNIGDAKAKISILSANLKNFKGKIDFTVAL